MSNYKFNRVHPPLMKDFRGDVYSVPNKSLRETYGPAEWTTSKRGKIRIGLISIYGDIVSHFELTRNIYWTMDIPPEHYAEDTIQKVTFISGVSEIQKHTMEKALEISSGAKGFGLSANVKATLKIKDETTREWHKEKIKESTQTFKSRYTYCTWRLVDELLLKKKTHSEVNGRQIPSLPIVVTNREMSCILSTYQDKWEDTESREVLAEDYKLQAAQEEPEITVISLPTGKLTLSDSRSK